MVINNKNLTNPENNLPLKETTNVLISRLANEWMKIGSKIKDPKPLFGNIMHEGEVAILFSNTGVGKSLLAVQLADAISKGNLILGLKSSKSKVLYFDFELSAKSFQRRYSINNETLYNFNEDFIRVEIDRDLNLEDTKYSFDEAIIDSIKYQTGQNKAEVLIIDNITFLSATNEKSKEALALMKMILHIARKNKTSILLIAHTPKRDVFRPIHFEDLAGSKALSNFVDVCFCIGESIKGNDNRYIKQLKNRNYPIEYGANNVINCQIVKNNCFLQFDLLGYGTEKEHLQQDDEGSNLIKYQEVRSLKGEGKSNIEIAEIYKCNEKTIRRWLKKTDI